MNGHSSNYQIYQLKVEMRNLHYFQFQNLKTNTLHLKNKNQPCSLQWSNRQKHWKDLNQECISIQSIFNPPKVLIKSFYSHNIKKLLLVKKHHKINYKNKNFALQQVLRTNKLAWDRQQQLLEDRIVV